MTLDNHHAQVQSRKKEIICTVITISIAVVFGTWMLQYAECGIKSRTLAWVDFPDNVVNGYKEMYQSCHNIFGQDYTHVFDDMIKFYPSLQSWRNSQ